MFIPRFIWPLLSVAAVAAPLPERATLTLYEPGQALTLPEDIKKPSATWLKKEHWYSVALRGKELQLDAVTQSAPSTWQTAHIDPAPSDFVPLLESLKNRLKPAGPALKLADDALFGVQVTVENQSGSSFPLTPGAYPGVLAAAPVLGDKWQAAFQLGGKPWTARAVYERRPDGALLAGSMKLLLQNAAGEEKVWVDPSDGMAFTRQQLLWIGDLNGDARPDLLLKRTWLTGENEYVLAIGDKLNIVAIDPERPTQTFSSGAMTTFDITHAAEGALFVPPKRFGAAAFSLSDATWNDSVGALDPALPKTLFDRQLKLHDEAMRFSFDYLPRAAGHESSSSSDRLWSRDIVVRVHFRGKTQILTELPKQIDGGFHLSVDKIDGQAVIRLSYYPHYNNVMTYYWRLDSAPEPRFRRVMTQHEQGC